MEQKQFDFAAKDFASNVAFFNFYCSYIERIVHFGQSLVRAFWTCPIDITNPDDPNSYDRWINRMTGWARLHQAHLEQQVQSELVSHFGLTDEVQAFIFHLAEFTGFRCASSPFPAYQQSFHRQVITSCQRFEEYLNQLDVYCQNAETKEPEYKSFRKQVVSDIYYPTPTEQHPQSLDAVALEELRQWPEAEQLMFKYMAYNEEVYAELTETYFLKDGKPSWHKDRKELCYSGRVIRTFERQGINNFRLLDAMESAGWPRRMASPFNANTTRDTVASVNLDCEVIRFRSDKGYICWEMKDGT